MAKFVTRKDLESRITAARVVQLYDEDNDKRLSDREEGALNETLAEADDMVIAALLNKGWTIDQLNTMSADRALRRCACQLAAMLSGMRRPEFRDTTSGKLPYAEDGELAQAMLKAYSRGDLRSRVETVAGTNRAIRGRWNQSTPKRIFGRDPSDPNDHLGDRKGF